MRNICKNIFTAILAVSLLASCILNPSKSTSLSSRIQHSLDNREYKYAYATLLDLQSDVAEDSQRDYQRFVSVYQKELEDGGVDYLRNHFKGNALGYGTKDSFKTAMMPELNEFQLVATEPGYSRALVALDEEFNKSRDLYPTRFPADKVIIGISKDEFKDIIPKKPIRTEIVRIPSTPPTDFVVSEYKFLLPKEYKVSGSQPIWIAFLNDELVQLGYGGIKHAEYVGYQWYLNEDILAGRVKKAEAMRILYQKNKEVYGEPDPLTNEYMTYLIMVSDKMDKGSITQTEAEYMVAQKQAEISEKMAAKQREHERMQAELRMHREQIQVQKRAQEQAARMQRSQMLLQGGLGMLYLNQMNQMNQSLRGIQQNTMPRSYSITPSGGGAYRVNPY